MRGHERSFPVRVHGLFGEARRHRASFERAFLQSTEERRYFDFARLSRLVQQSGCGSISADHSQTVCLLRATWHRYVQARHQRTRSDLALPVQLPTGEDLCYPLHREEQRSSSARERSRGWRSIITFSPLSRERGHQATSERVRRGRSTVSVVRRVHCQCSVFVVSHGKHADGMKHATTGRERVPERIGVVARTYGRGMGIRTHGTLHTASDQCPREADRQTSGGRVVQSNEHGVSVPWFLLSWSPVHPTRGERRQWETHDPTARRDPKEHRLPTSLCQSRRAVGMRLERYEKRSCRKKVSGCCISSATARAVDDDVTADPDRRACRHRVRYGRVRRSHCVRTLQKYSPCSRTSVWRATISVRSCADTPKNTASLNNVSNNLHITDAKHTNL